MLSLEDKLQYIYNNKKLIDKKRLTEHFYYVNLYDHPTVQEYCDIENGPFNFTNVDIDKPSVQNGCGGRSILSKKECLINALGWLQILIDYENLLEDFISTDYDLLTQNIKEPNKFVFGSQTTSLKMEDGYIYIIKMLNFYKIDKSKNFKKRFGEYTKLPVEPEIIIAEKCKDYHNLEKLLHNTFAYKNSNGEWFTLTEEEVEQTVNIISQNKIQEGINNEV